MPIPPGDVVELEGCHFADAQAVGRKTLCVQVLARNVGYNMYRTRNICYIMLYIAIITVTVLRIKGLEVYS